MRLFVFILSLCFILSGVANASHHCCFDINTETQTENTAQDLPCHGAKPIADEAPVETVNAQHACDGCMHTLSLPQVFQAAVISHTSISVVYSQQLIAQDPERIYYPPKHIA